MDAQQVFGPGGEGMARAGLAYAALALPGLGALAWLAVRRGGPRDPVPRGSCPAHGAGVLAALVAFAVGQVVHALVAPPPPGGDVPPRVLAMLGGAAAGHAVGIGAGLAVLRALRGPAPAASPAPASRAALAGALTGVAFLPVSLLVAVALYAGLALAGRGPPQPQRLVGAFVEGDAPTVVAIALMAVVVAPVAEEWIYRGALYRGLRASARPGVAAFLSAAAFSLVHLEPGNAVALPVTFLLGLALADLAERTGGLVAPIAMHACYNGAQVVVMFVMRGAAGPPGGG